MKRIRPTTSRAAALMLLALAACLGGCQNSQYASPLITEYDQANTRAELDFWHGLAEQPVTTNNDALHGLIELAHGSDPAGTYEERIAWLAERGYLDWNWYRPPDQAVTRGTVASVLCRILDIKGGLTMRVIGPHPRYATRALIYRDIMDQGTPQQGLSGIAFVGVMGKARDYAVEKGI